MHFEVLSTKYVNFNNFRQFFENFAIKFLFFLAIFLEFFVLGNNHTLQEPLYTRSNTLILCIERNKKNQISNKLNLQVCKLNLARQTQTKQVFGKSTWTCAQHYLQLSNISLIVFHSGEHFKTT